MTAPGDSVLLLILLAVFLACTAYAAGRLHQRYQTSQERKDAYLDGYESGSSSVFSAAVRMLGPRRPVRASAQVTPPEPGKPGKPAEPEPAPDAPAAEPGTSLGFPLPPPPPPYATTEPDAVGGVTYLPFPDPRPADGSAPPLREAPTQPHARRRVADRSGPARGTDRPAAAGPEPAPAEDAENISAEDVSEGRHTVPDELVRAATYRLPRDRVFRARVAGGRRLPEEPTTHLPEAEPRQS